jgi:hypothetical protein
MQQNQMNSVPVFVEHLLAEKGLSIQDEEAREEIQADLIRRVEMFINATVLEFMPPEKLEDFNNIVKEGDPVKIQDFCEQNIPDLQEVVAKALLRFRDTYLGAGE